MRWSYLALATGHGNVDEAAGVCEPLLGAALGRLLLLLRFDLAFRLVVTGGRGNAAWSVPWESAT